MGADSSSKENNILLLNKAVYQCLFIIFLIDVIYTLKKSNLWGN